MVTKKEPAVKDPWDDDEHDETAVKHVGTPTRDDMVVTLKGGSGYNAPWLVLHADSVEDAIAKMQADSWDELADLTARKNKEFERLFGGVPNVAQRAASGSGGGSWGNKAKASSGSSEIPSGTCSVHNCDLVFADAFTKRDGSKVNARVGCPVPKCYSDTVWQNDDGTWGK